MKYQMHCPKCNHEWAYDNGALDEDIARLGIEVQTLIRQLEEHHMLPYDEKRRRTDWWRRTKAALARKNEALAKLKAFRKSCDQQVKAAEHLIFRQTVRECCGEQAYREMMEKARRGLEAYKVSGLMLHEYTRANYKPDVTSINKL